MTYDRRSPPVRLRPPDDALWGTGVAVFLFIYLPLVVVIIYCLPRRADRGLAAPTRSRSAGTPRWRTTGR